MDSPSLQIGQVYFQLKGYLVYFVVNFKFFIQNSSSVGRVSTPGN